MCTSQPKIPDPVPPPAAPPPPTATAKTVKTKNKVGNTKKKKNTSSLTVQRGSVNTGSLGSGSGSKINY